MLSAACPRCGSPRPMSFARPELLECASCGYRGPPAPEVEQALRNAQGLLAQLPRRTRHAGYRARDAKLVAFGARFRLVAEVLVVGLAAVAVAALGPMCLRPSGSPISAWRVCPCAGPLALMLPALLGALLWARRAALAAQAAQPAISPDAPGRPPRCRVCGADLRLVASQATVDCDYCASPNVVSAEILQPRQLELTRVEQYAAGLRDESRRIERGSRALVVSLRLGLAAALLIGPMIGCAIGALLSSLLG